MERIDIEAVILGKGLKKSYLKENEVGNIKETMEERNQLLDMKKKEEEMEFIGLGI